MSTKFIKVLFFLVITTVLSPAVSSAQSLSDIFKKGSTVTNILEGVLTKSNLSVADLAGEWTSNGPAISFKGDNFLKKAGGIAAAAAIESKLEPYYQKYGLNGAVITIDQQGTFTFVVKKMKLSGTVTKDENESGAFIFNFTALGKVKIGEVKCYAQKSYNSLDLMFDATKLKKIMSAVAGFSGISLAKTVSSLLDSYDGLCVGFKCSLTGQASTGSSVTNGNLPDENSSTGQSSQNSGTTTTKSGLESLKDLLKNKTK